ncbi:MAG: ABC-F family ATP-binding cassette domain-containing protein, partial [Planctomycetaceae bacterium]|nr:ABC-F family ATP-binding cassette domain-containing protein [Planctomycetaceae bacterium]
MSLLSLREIRFSFGGQPLLEGIDLEIDKGERIGLLGRNGAGKSTLMKIMVGEIEPDDGVIKANSGVRIARLVQEVPDGTEETVSEVVAAGAKGGDLEPWQIEQSVEVVLT